MKAVAAAILDPASSHGALRALMSGILAAHLIAQVLRHETSVALAAAEYTRWLHEWFLADVREQMNLYAKLEQPPPWAKGALHYR
jgi:flavin-dependent dehydrogenase